MRGATPRRSRLYTLTSHHISLFIHFVLLTSQSSDGFKYSKKIYKRYELNERHTYLSPTVWLMCMLPLGLLFLVHTHTHFAFLWNLWNLIIKKIFFPPHPVSVMNNFLFHCCISIFYALYWWFLKGSYETNSTHFSLFVATFFKVNSIKTHYLHNNKTFYIN